MKKTFKYIFIVIALLFAFSLFTNTKANALIDDSFDNGDYDGGFIIPDDNYSSEELYQACHSYITTNIINAESLTEALNGKKYSNFTQEDCMEMINIASKREVIKNELDLIDVNETIINGITYSLIDNVFTINGTSTEGFGIVFFLSETLVLSETYTFSKISNFNLKNGTYFTLWNDGDTDLQINAFANTDTGIPNKSSLTGINMWLDAGITYNNLKISFQLEKGSTATPYVSYDYHREYYEEGIDYADGRVNTSSSSYTQGVSSGLTQGYKNATTDSKMFLSLIPTTLGAVIINAMPILSYEVYGLSIMNVISLIAVLGLVIIVIKFLV